MRMRKRNRSTDRMYLIPAPNGIAGDGMSGLLLLSPSTRQEESKLAKSTGNKFEPDSSAPSVDSTWFTFLPSLVVPLPGCLLSLPFFPENIKIK